jgi:hypothetical protein
MDSNDIKLELNSRIDIFNIQNSYLDVIDPISNVLNFDVFSRVQTLSILNSNINYIHQSTFYYFGALKTLKLKVTDWKTFWVNSLNLEWMQGLNYKQNSSLNGPWVSGNNLFSLNLGDGSDMYYYPEDDFCHFKEFPHYREILPIVNFFFRGECTCTLVSILRYSKFYRQGVNSEFSHSTGNQRCMNGDYNATIRHCDLDVRFAACKPFTISQTEMTQTNSLSITQTNSQTNSQQTDSEYLITSTPSFNSTQKRTISFLSLFFEFVFIVIMIIYNILS